MIRYEHDGDAIYRESFATIRAEASLEHLDADIARIAVRMIHACGMTDLVEDLAFSAGFASTARTALVNGAPIFCDSNMVAAGITRRRLPSANDVICTLREDPVPALAAQLGTTRSAAAMELWRPRLAGSVVAIGNAPTSLFRLLEMLEAGCDRPAAVIGVPVGFVGAAESKLALSEHPSGIEFLTVHGRRGGSAITAAAVNALASEEE
jgi:precorrin-8X/cobalt-precorrin-8 methylmutase